jgi:serine/threonine protein kinase
MSALDHQSIVGKKAMTRHSQRKNGSDEINLHDIQHMKKIGEGMFGDIFKGDLYGQLVAVKCLKVPGEVGSAKGEEVLREFYDEVRILKKLRHPNIVEFLGACTQGFDSTRCIVTEFLPHGCLESWLEKMKTKNQISISLILDVCIDIARGLNWMHHKGYIHRCVNLRTNFII